jgi:hypothetical protein
LPAWISLLGLAEGAASFFSVVKLGCHRPLLRQHRRGLDLQLWQSTVGIACLVVGGVAQATQHTTGPLLQYVFSSSVEICQNIMVTSNHTTAREFELNALKLINY